MKCVLTQKGAQVIAEPVSASKYYDCPKKAVVGKNAFFTKREADDMRMSMIYRAINSKWLKSYKLFMWASLLETLFRWKEAHPLWKPIGLPTNKRVKKAKLVVVETITHNEVEPDYEMEQSAAVHIATHITDITGPIDILALRQ